MVTDPRFKNRPSVPVEKDIRFKKRRSFPEPTKTLGLPEFKGREALIFEEEQTTSLLRKLYPDSSKDESAFDQLRDLETFSQEDPEGFFADLTQRGTQEEQDFVLRKLGASDEFFIERNIAEEGEAKFRERIDAVYPGMSIDEFQDFTNTNFEGFIGDMQRGGMTSAKLDLLNRGMGIPFESDTQTDIQDIFKQIEIEVTIGDKKQFVTITENGKAYNNKGQWVGTYNRAARRFTEANTEEGFIKDSLIDPWVFASNELVHTLQQFGAGTLANILFRDLDDIDRKVFGDEYVDKVNAGNRQLRDDFRFIKGQAQRDFDKWIVSQPDLIPKPEYTEGLTKHPELWKDLAYFAYAGASIAPLSFGVMALIAGGVVTGNPVLGLAAGASLMIPAEAENSYEALLDAGAPEKEAALWSLLIGTTAGAIEVFSDLFFLKVVAAPIAGLFRKEIINESAKLTVAHLIKKGVWAFTAPSAIEVIEEELTLAVNNAVLKIYDENKGLWDDAIKTAADTFAATAFLGVTSGSATIVGVSVQMAAQKSDTEKLKAGWVQDPVSQGWFRPKTKEEIVSELEQGGVLEPTEVTGEVEGVRTLSLEEVSKLETRIPIDLIRKDEAVEIARLTKEIQRDGITEPIVIRVREDGSQIVWDGIHRLIVAQDLGIKNIPVRFIDGEGLGVKKPPTVPQPTVTPEVKEPLNPDIAKQGIQISDAMPPEAVVETVPETVDATPIVNDINIVDEFRPTRFVFDKMGLFDIWQSAFKAETLKAEEQVAFNKELNKHANAVGKDVVRRELVWEFVNNSNQAVFGQLTVEEKQAATWWKKTADDWANRLNIPQNERIKDYIPHIFDEQAKQNQDNVLDASISMAFSKKLTDKVRMPFLEKRLGKELGLVKDPFLAAQAYQNVALRKFYYEPILQKLKVVAEHTSTPESARSYLRRYSERMTGKPALIDKEISKAIKDIANSVRRLPGGNKLADMLEHGNPAGMAAYNLTSALYVMWLGFKPTTAIRNLSQHGLIIADVNSIQDFGNGIRLRFTKEGRAAVAESLVWRSRRGAFVESIDSSMASKWTDKVRETALFMFRKADEQNVKDAFLSGYAEAKRLYPEAGRELWIKRGDEVAQDTQYLYTKMNSLAVSQTAPGKVGAMLTTWAINWLELMNKFARGRKSKVYIDLVEQSDGKFTLKDKNWLQSRQSLLVYMTIVGLAYGLNEQDWNRVRAFEYTGVNSIRTFANLAGGEFPALQLPGAVADLIAGSLTGDERAVKTAWNELTRAFSILNQVERVASGERDWLSLLFYLEGQDHQVRMLKDDWEDNWEPYDELTDPLVRANEFPTLSESAALKKWRIQNPKIEARMFITNRLETLSSDEARAEVQRLIKKHNINTDVINGYEKIFGLDTDVELKKTEKRMGNLEKLEIGKEAKYFTTSNQLTEINNMVKVNGRDKVERDSSPFTSFALGQQDSWQPFEDYEPGDARTLYRQSNPDVEASLYMFGKVSDFKNPESAKILLRWMDKYNIPMHAIPAFIKDPSKYDELFTQKFELEQKNFDLTTQYDNFGNSEAENFIEDTDERKLAREKFKEGNPNWVADQRRIEAIDNDATSEMTEKWADRGRVVDEFSAGSSEAKAWLLDNPETHQWALGNKLLTDDGSDWNEDIIRLNVELGGLEEGSEQHDTVKRKIEAHSDGFTQIDDYVEYYNDLSAVGFRRERFLSENPDFAEEMKRLKEIEPPVYIPPVEYDNLIEKESRTPDEEHRINAYDKKIAFEHIDNYVSYFSLEKPDDYPVGLSFYEDDFFLMENPAFYKEVYLGTLENQRADFRLVPPTRGILDKWVAYNKLTNQVARDEFRLLNPDLDEWGVSIKIWTRTMTDKRRRQGITPTERFEEDVAKAEEERRKALEEIAERLEGLG